MKTSLNKKKRQINQINNRYTGHDLFIYALIVLLCFGCKISNKEKVYEDKSISNLTLYKNHLYFGAGYNLCCIDLSTKILETP